MKFIFKKLLIKFISQSTLLYIKLIKVLLLHGIHIIIELLEEIELIEMYILRFRLKNFQFK